MSVFKDRLRARDLIVGTWIKTPSTIVTEVLSLSPLDCLCLDAEHAPFDRDALDGAILAGRAYGKPILVRPSGGSPEHILNALDCGATGVVVPHIASAEQARLAVRHSHYGSGGRGFAGSSRAAGYTTRTMAAHLEQSAAATTVIAQIEDAEALAVIDDIAAVDGVDALFIGRADLTVALGATSPVDPVVVDAVERICESGRRHGRAVGMFVGDHGELPRWRSRGASFFLLASDHGFLLKGARALMDEVRVAVA